MWGKREKNKAVFKTSWGAECLTMMYCTHTFSHRSLCVSSGFEMFLRFHIGLKCTGCSSQKWVLIWNIYIFMTLGRSGQGCQVSSKLPADLQLEKMHKNIRYIFSKKVFFFHQWFVPVSSTYTELQNKSTQTCFCRKKFFILSALI